MNAAWLARITQHSTPHRLAPPLTEVLVTDTNDAPQGVAFALATLRLPTLRIPLHVFYCELSHNTAELRFDIDGEHYRLCRSWSSVRDELDRDGFPAVQYPQSFKGTHIELVSMNLPTPQDPKPWGLTKERIAQLEDTARSWGFADIEKAVYELAIEELVQQTHRGCTLRSCFGAPPRWTQQARTPVDAHGNPMHFVGQLRADACTDEVGDFDLFFFVNEEQTQVVQLAQNS